MATTRSSSTRSSSGGCTSTWQGARANGTTLLQLMMKFLKSKINQWWRQWIWQQHCQHCSTSHQQTMRRGEEKSEESALVALQQSAANGDSNRGKQQWQEAAVEWHHPQQHSISVQQAVTAATVHDWRSNCQEQQSNGSNSEDCWKQQLCSTVQ